MGLIAPIGPFALVTDARALRSLIALLFWAYLALLPFAHWLAPSGWLPLPNIPLMLAAGLCVLGGTGGFRFAWRDVLLLLLVVVAILSTLLNAQSLMSKSVNHLAALVFVTLLNYFFGARVMFGFLGDSWKTPVAIGFFFACGLCVVEFGIVNFLHIPLPGPRPSAVEYTSSFILGTRPRSTFSESGHFAFYLSCVTPVLVMAYRQAGRTWIVGGILAAFLICAVLLFSTSLFLVISIWALMYIIVRRIFLRPWGFVITLAFLGSLVLFASAYMEFADVLVLHKFRTDSYGDRQEKFAAVVDLVMRSDFWHVLFGYGMGSFQALGQEDTISSYTNFTRDCGLVGLALFVAMLLPLEYVARNVPRAWRRTFLFLGVGMLLYFSAVPNYYFPHLAFVLGLMSTASVARPFASPFRQAPPDRGTPA